MFIVRADTYNSLVPMQTLAPRSSSTHASVEKDQGACMGTIKARTYTRLLNNLVRVAVLRDHNIIICISYSTI